MGLDRSTEFLFHWGDEWVLKIVVIYFIISHSKVLRKYINAFSSYSAKTKRDGQTDGHTDGRGGGGGALQYLPSRAFIAAGDNKTNQSPSYHHPPGFVFQIMLDIA